MDFLTHFQEFIIYILAYLPGTPKPQSIPLESPKPKSVPLRPIALKSSALGRLPIELIHTITSFLPRASTASFSLCCRPINAILGTQGTKCFGEDREEFLALLERDLPTHILCSNCQKFHAIDKADRHSPARCYNRNLGGVRFDVNGVKRPCWKANSSAELWLHRHFSFVIFQMAMKAYRQGLDCSKLLSLLSHGSEKTYDTQCTALARIVAGSLLLRRKTFYVYIKPSLEETHPHPLVETCCHVAFCRVEGSDRYHYAENWDSPAKDYRDLKGISRCRFCHTEFQIEFTDFRGQANVMVVTTWKNLGEGRSFSDLNYHRHLIDGILMYSCGELPPVEYERGSIRDQFEWQGSFESVFNGVLFPSP